MKAVILAGGYGTRISEETSIRPKPMVEIGGKPILWHIMKLYSSHQVNEFIICCGYKGNIIKEYFANYFLYRSDVTFNLAENQMDVHKNGVEPWKVTLIDTGESTMTGGRLKRVAKFLEDETFCLTYGDGVSDVDISASLDFHRRNKRMATLTAVQPPGRFGAFNLQDEEDLIEDFREKSVSKSAWINGGYFVLEPQVLDYIADDSTIWERDPLEKLASEAQLSAFRHYGFWHPMDTLRDRNTLEDLWSNNKAPWKVWS